MYAQFLWQFPLSKFDFIGITEHYDDDFAFFSDRYLDGAPQAPSVNLDPHGVANQSILDADLRSRIADLPRQGHADLTRKRSHNARRASSSGWHATPSCCRRRLRDRPASAVG